MSSYPSGTVTFLFTDIEGSTKLAQERPDIWESLRERHHSILREAIEEHHGYIFQIVGDAFCTAFHKAGNALKSAIQIQRQLQNESWGDVVIRVRIGIHTGEAEFQEDGQYQGYLTLSLVQRIMSAGYGGQVLVSQATYELTQRMLSLDLKLQDMGKHRFKNFPQTERIYQVVVPGLINDFPPLKTLAASPNNLPLQPTPFIGRESELATLTAFLADPKVRLVTIIGPGGMGKTRLALATAERMLDGTQFPDGIFFVNLAPLIESNQIVPAMAEALNFRLQGEDGRSSQEKILDYLQDKQLLLLFDNCEHILDGMDLVVEILQAASGVKILATSRERLQMRAEQVYLLEGLEFPDWETPEDAAEYTAVRLFLQSARRNQPKFTLQDRDDLTYLARICRLVAGMPLAVELAAAWVDMLPLVEIAADLQKGLDFLETDMRDMPERHRSIRAAINHSWERLDEKEQDIFSKLSVFRGGFTREAAEAVAGADLRHLGRLVNKSFLQYIQDADRYQVHELMRQYGTEKLASTASVRTQHLEFFAAFAQKADAGTFGSEPEIWVKRLLADMDNFRAAMDWAVESDQGQAGMHLAGSLHAYWISLGDWREGRQRLARLLALSTAVGRTPARVLALLEAGNLASNMGDYETGLAFYEEGRAISLERGEPGKLILGWILLELADHLASRDLTASQQLNEQGVALLREVGEPWQIWLGLHEQGWMAIKQGKYTQACIAYSEALAFVEKIGSRWLSGISQRQLGELLYFQGDYGAALPYLEESVAILRPLGDLRHQPLGSLGAIAVLQGNFQQAAAYFEERLENHRRQGSKVYYLRDLSDLGIATARLGDFAQAAALFRQALSLAPESKYIYDVAVYLLGVAGIQQLPYLAAQLLGAAQAAFERSDEFIEPLYHTESTRIENEVRATLGEDVFAATYERSKKMTLNEAMILAMNEQLLP
jgi:predicted ATPase/class 3 adenylate cyclase